MPRLLHRFVPMALTLPMALALPMACDLGGETAPATVNDACKGVAWPAASGTVLRVAPCGADSGDGSSLRPFKTLAAALATVKAGSTVAVAKGTYAESLTLPVDVTLVGTGPDEVRIEPVQGAGITIKGKGAVRIAGISVRGAPVVGISVHETAVVLVNVAVENTALAPATSGHGVQIVDAPKATLEGCRIVGNSGIGVFASGTGPVAIIDPLFLKDPKAAGSAVGIIDPLFTPRSIVQGNLQGGIAIIDPLFLPGANGAPALTLKATDVAGNGNYGVALYNAGARIERSVVRGTVKRANSSAAEGVLVALGKAAPTEAVSVVVDAGSVVTGHARAGVYVAAPATLDIAGEVSLCGRCGVWATGDKAIVRLGKTAHLAQNAMIGVVVANGAMLDLDGARISGTKPAPLLDPAGGVLAEVADGIGVYGKAHARISGATITGNPRAGIVAKNCAANSAGLPDLEVKGTTITGSKYGVVVNGQYSQSGSDPAASSAPKNAGNSYDDVGTEGSGVELPVPDNP